MHTGYIIRNQDRPHFITCTVVNWIDVFTRKSYRDILIDSLAYCIKEKGMILYGYVIMSNHIHLIVQSSKGKISALIRDFKKFTATQILQAIQNEPESRREWMMELFSKATETHIRNTNYQFWKYGNHPEEIYSSRFLWVKLNYIHQNPVYAGIVAMAEHYVYSSASNYARGKGLLAVELVDGYIDGVG